MALIKTVFDFDDFFRFSCDEWKQKYNFFEQTYMQKNVDHFRTLWFCVFFWKLPSKEQFLCVKKEIAYHYSRMKSGKKYKFQFMKEVVKFLFPVWPAEFSFKSILQSIEKMRGTEVFKLVIQCWKIFITISGRVIGVLDPNCIQNWCKKVELAPLQREIEPLQNWSLKKSKKRDMKIPTLIKLDKKFA